MVTLTVALAFLFTGGDARSQALTVYGNNGELMPVWENQSAAPKPSLLQPTKGSAMQSPVKKETPDPSPKEKKPVPILAPVATPVPVPAVETPLDGSANNYAPTGAKSSAKDKACSQRYAPRSQGNELLIIQGDYISKKLSDWASFQGYTMSWEVEEYLAKGNMTLAGNFEETLMAFKDSLAESGVYIDILIYRNCVLRIVERK